MAIDNWAGAQARIEAALRAERVPGIVIAAARDHGRARILALGTDAAGASLTAESLFPVASVTKLATALAALRLVASGAVELDAPLARYLPDAASAREGVTIRRLLAHTAGLPVDVEPAAAPYDHGLDWRILARACLATPTVATPGARVCYSNVGYGLVALLTERLTGLPFARALDALVLTPLGVEGYLGAQPPRPPARLGGRLGDHAGDEREPFNSAFWRGLALPWAGLLTTAAGALALVRAYAGVPDGFLPSELRAAATRDQTGGLPGGTPGFLEWAACPWGLGPELRGVKRPFYVSADVAPTSFGHAGASGSLAWADPEAGIAWAILGARTLPGWWLRWPALDAAIREAV